MKIDQIIQEHDEHVVNYREEKEKEAESLVERGRKTVQNRLDDFFDGELRIGRVSNYDVRGDQLMSVTFRGSFLDWKKDHGIFYIAVSDPLKLNSVYQINYTRGSGVVVIDFDEPLIHQPKLVSIIKRIRARYNYLVEKDEKDRQEAADEMNENIAYLSVDGEGLHDQKTLAAVRCRNELIELGMNAGEAQKLYLSWKSRYANEVEIPHDHEQALIDNAVFDYREEYTNYFREVLRISDANNEVAGAIQKEIAEPFELQELTYSLAGGESCEESVMILPVDDSFDPNRDWVTVVERYGGNWIRRKFLCPVILTEKTEHYSSDYWYTDSTSYGDFTMADPGEAYINHLPHQKDAVVNLIRSRMTPFPTEPLVIDKEVADAIWLENTKQEARYQVWQERER